MPADQGPGSWPLADPSEGFLYRFNALADQDVTSVPAGRLPSIIQRYQWLGRMADTEAPGAMTGDKPGAGLNLAWTSSARPRSP